ncbi:MAG: glycyl-radical enzyme activating protein [Lachnospiraceae bacterium]
MEYLDTRGRIFDIQRYSIHDGDGIRTILFLKGCFFRCQWCCNPESQRAAPETMLVQGKPRLIGQDITVAEAMQTLRKDRRYYQRSGGGVTLSGGEILFQPQFARDVLRACQEEDIRTAVESTAYAPYEVIETLLPFLDQYLLDIKHMNSQKHREFVGRPNELVLENAARLAAVPGLRLSIRVPVVPGFNDTAEEIAQIARFAGTLAHVERIHLLPYHRLGQDKYEGLGRKYLLSEIAPPDGSTMEALLRTAEQASGLECQIGG